MRIFDHKSATERLCTRFATLSNQCEALKRQSKMDVRYVYRRRMMRFARNSALKFSSNVSQRFPIRFVLWQVPAFRQLSLAGLCIHRTYKSSTPALLNSTFTFDHGYERPKHNCVLQILLLPRFSCWRNAS
jgi:hypothetical protein